MKKVKGIFGSYYFFEPGNVKASKENEHIYFAIEHSNRGYTVPDDFPHHSIYQYDINTNEKKRIHELEVPPRYMALSPDGTYLAFSKNRGNGYEKHILNTETKSVHRVFDGMSTEFSNKSDSLFLGTDDDLFIIGANQYGNTRFEYIPEENIQDSGPSNGFEHAAWSADDRYIAFNRGKVLYTHRVGSREADHHEYDRYIENVEWLDNEELLFVLDDEVYRSKLDELPEKELLAKIHKDAQGITLSPDKEKLAYTVTDKFHIQSLDNNEESEQPLESSDFSNIDMMLPQWIGNNRVLLIKRASPSALYLFNLSDQSITQL